MAVLSPQWANAGRSGMENICIAANTQQDGLQGVDGLHGISQYKPDKLHRTHHFIAGLLLSQQQQNPIQRL